MLDDDSSRSRPSAVRAACPPRFGVHVAEVSVLQHCLGGVGGGKHLPARLPKNRLMLDASELTRIRDCGSSKQARNSGIGKCAKLAEITRKHSKRSAHCAELIRARSKTPAPRCSELSLFTTNFNRVQRIHAAHVWTLPSGTRSGGTLTGDLQFWEFWLSHGPERGRPDAPCNTRTHSQGGTTEQEQECIGRGRTSRGAGIGAVCYSHALRFSTLVSTFFASQRCSVFIV